MKFAAKLKPTSEPAVHSDAKSVNPRSTFSSGRLAMTLSLALSLALVGPVSKAFAGDVAGWGRNLAGEIGDGTLFSRAAPVSVLGDPAGPPLGSVVAVAAGASHVLALKSDGTVWSWGANLFGQLGSGDTAEHALPVQVVGIGGVGFLTNVAAIAAGDNFSLALKRDGSVCAWGFNAYGQLGDGTTLQRITPVQVRAPGLQGFLTGVTTIAAGGSHALAVLNDTSVVGWGLNFEGQIGDGTNVSRAAPVPVVAAGGGTFTGVAAVAAGFYHSLALKRDGSVCAWGYNSAGELGDGDTIWRRSPVPVAGLTGVTAIAAGQYHSLARTSDGKVWVWGGQFGVPLLGNGTTGISITPAPVPGPGGTGFLNAVRISSGESSLHSIAVAADGSVFTWGFNAFGQLGDGVQDAPATPVQVIGPGGAGLLTGASVAATGAGDTIVVQSDGTLSTWGQNNHHQLDDASTQDRPTPAQALGPAGRVPFTGVISVAEGTDFTLALKGNGTVWGWGHDTHGQLGDGQVGGTNRWTPVQTRGLSGILALAAGQDHGLAVGGDGSTWAWGSNTHGQVGDNGPFTERHTPVQVAGPDGAGLLSGVVSVAAGQYHSLALKSDGTVWAWGSNSAGQLGIGDAGSSSTPARVQGPGGVGFLNSIVAISAGGSHSLALRNDGTVLAWGENVAGELGDNTTTNRLTPVQVVGPGGTGILTGEVAISAGAHHNLALQSNGAVWSWGQGQAGELGDNSPLLHNSTVPIQVLGPGGVGFLSGVTAIAAGSELSFAVRGDGSALGWGYNRSGQLGIGSASLPPYAVAAPTRLVGIGGLGMLGSVVGIAAGSDDGVAITGTFTGPVPTITGFSPAAGVPGAAVTIIGTLFTGATRVRFGGMDASFSVDSDTQITATAPAGIFSAPIRIYTPLGIATSASSFGVPTPVITSFTPTSGGPGATVVLTGSGFTGATAVRFNGADASYVVNSDSKITTTVPASATTGPITVVTPAGVGTSSSFTAGIPVITGFTPGSGAAGALVTVTGSGFSTTRAVQFSGVSAAYTIDSDSQLVAVFPAGAPTGPISITNAAGTGTSTTNFTVNPPVITSVAPTSVHIGGMFTITGMDLSGALGMQINGQPAIYAVVSNTQVVGIVPTGVTGGTVTITTAAGSATSTDILVVPAPVITGFNPAAGSVKTTVTVSGSGFFSATSVKLNGEDVVYTVPSDGQLTFDVPADGSSGLITITTPSGTGTSARPFTVQ